MSCNNESILEKSLGVRNQWKVEKSSFVQEWIAGISGSCNTAGLNIYEKKVGLFYTVKLTKDLNLE